MADDFNFSYFRVAAEEKYTCCHLYITYEQFMNLRHFSLLCFFFCPIFEKLQ